MRTLGTLGCTIHFNRNGSWGADFPLTPAVGRKAAGGAASRPPHTSAFLLLFPPAHPSVTPGLGMWKAQGGSLSAPSSFSFHVSFELLLSDSEMFQHKMACHSLPQMVPKLFFSLLLEAMD